MKNEDYDKEFEQLLIFYKTKIGYFAKIIFNNEKSTTTKIRGELVDVLVNKLIIKNIASKQVYSIEAKDVTSSVFEPIKNGKGDKQ